MRTAKNSLFLLFVLSVPITTQTAVLQLRHRRDPLPCLSCLAAVLDLRVRAVPLALPRVPSYRTPDDPDHARVPRRESSDSLSRKTEIALCVVARSNSIGSKESSLNLTLC